MRKKQFGRKIAAIAMATAMTISAAFSGGVNGGTRVHAASDTNAPSVLDSASSVNYAYILGRATDFGILADTFYQNNHMETTFAIDKFYNGDNIPNEVDFPLSDFTAQFLVGDVKAGYFHLGGKETAKVYNIETSPSIANGFEYPWKDQNDNYAYTGMKGKFNFDHNFYLNGKVLNVIGREDVSTNIATMISDVKKISNTINTKAVNDQYAYVIPEEAFSDNAVTINLNYDNYKGKVVYINVNEKLADRFTRPCGDNGSGQGVHIIKDESTVVVFNFANNYSKVRDLNADSTSGDGNADGVKISKFSVSTDGGNTWSNTYTDSSMSEQVLKVKDSINQTVIFNIVASGPVELDTSGGAVLVPGTNNVNITGSSTGWLVAGGKAANNGAEWHYIYRGGNQEYSSDGEGQIHFSARKSITTSYNGENTTADSSISIDKDEFTFNWYETDSSYKTDGITPQKRSNQATGTIKFPQLTFYSSDKVNETQYVNDTRTEVLYNNQGNLFETYNSEPISQINSRAEGLKLIIEYTSTADGTIGIDSRSAENWNDYMARTVNASAGSNTIELNADEISSLFGGQVLGNYLCISGNSDVTVNSVKLEYPVVVAQVTSRDLTDKEKEYYVAPGVDNARDFYYYIDEVDAGTIDSKGIERSKGYIKIHLKVTNDNGKLSYAVDSETVLGNGDVFFTNGSFGGQDIVNMSGVEFGLLDFFNRYTNDVEIDKVAVAGGEEIGGATLTITSKDGYPFDRTNENVKVKRSDGTNVDLDYKNKKQGFTILDFVYKSISYTTEAGKHTILSGLPKGDYILTETTTPGGYLTAEEIEFSIDEKGNVSSTYANGNVITMVDSPINVVISKKAMGGGSELEGADLKVEKLASDGKTVESVIDSWTSGKTAKEGTYKLTETTAPDGYKVAESIIFEVTSDGKVKVNGKEVTDNTVVMEDAPAKGSLVITKSFANDCITEEEKEGGLQFTVTTVKDSVKYYLKADGTLTTDETVYTLKPDFTYDSGKNTWTKTFNNVPVGTYTVDEVNTTIEGYKFKGSTYNGANGTESSARKITVEADKEATENIVDDYEKVASLTVNKAVTDAEAAAAAAGKEYSIALKDSSGKLFYNGTEFTTSEKYYVITTAAPVTWENLPVGQTYTIVEQYGQNNVRVNIEGFTFNGFSSAPVELTKDTTVTVTNDYTRDKGNLVITKTVKGPVTEDEFNGKLTFTIVDKNNKPITVTKNDGVTTGTSVDLTLKDYFTLVSSGNNEFKYELRVENVPTGTYTVTETNSTFDGYVLTKKTGDESPQYVKKYEQPGDDTVVDFVDEYEMAVGSLEIVKNFKDAPSNLDASKIEFEIEGPARFNNGTKLTVTYDMFTDGKYVISDAPIGDYIVTETSRQDSLIDGNYKYTFNAGASTVTGKTTVAKDTTAKVSLKNVYDKEEILGSLEIEKTVAMNDGSAIPSEAFINDKAFKVSVRNTDTGLYVADTNGSYSEKPVWFDIKAGTKLELTNLKLGNYTVSEDVADATKVDYRIIYDGSQSISEGTAVLTADSTKGNVKLDNVYKHYETVTDYPVFFSKEDSLSGAEIAGAEIALYKGADAEGTPIASWTSSLTSHVENLEEGTYTFKETVAPSGYDIVEKAITFTVKKDDTVEKGYSVKLIDLSDEVCYQRADGTLVLKDDPMLGILKVVKVITTDTGNKPEVSGFNVTVKNLKNNMYVQDINGKLGDTAADIFVPIGADGVGSVEITKLRPARYLVVEKEDGKAVKGFIYDANGSIAELEKEVTLADCDSDVEKVTPVEVELKNSYKEDIGNLAITKSITGDNPGKTEFKVTVKDADGKYLAADGKLSTDEVVLTVKVGETLTIQNVPSGKYTVTEDVADAANVTGYKFNSDNSVTGKDATVTYGNTAAVELINDYTEVPTGKLYVHVKEEKSGKDVPDATVKATNKTTGETKTYKTNAKGEIVDENGNTPELPIGDYTVVVSDVPKGYEVTTGESADVTVPKNDTGRHEAIIKTVRGGIIITVYDEETGDVVPNAEVTITTPDGVTKTFVTDADGQVKEYAQKDQFGNYTQLPGTFTYVVTKVPDGYKVTTGESQTGTVIAEKLTELEARIAPKTGGLDIKVVDEKTGAPVYNATVEVITPDGTKVILTTDKDGMITKFAEKDATGKYTAKVGEYKITVTKVPEGYSVTTGQTKIETVVEGEVKHHIAKIATATKTVITDTTSTNTTNKTNTTKKTDTNAKTGDATSVAGIMALMLLALCGIGFIIRRKKEDEK